MTYRYFFLFLVLTSPVLNTARAEDCRCPGRELESKFKGGDTKLGWHFSASLVQEGRPNFPPLVCYKRGVKNSSDATVLNIRWDVASFRRHVLPPHFANDSCVTLPGQLSISPISGPLYYGISSDTYDTTVQPPRGGWQQSEVQSDVQKAEFPPIRSVFEFGFNAEGDEATITIHSYVTLETGFPARLIYEVENRGSRPVSFLMNLPATGGMQKLEFLRPTFLKQDSRMFFESEVESQVTAQTAMVLISDAKDTKLGLAAEIVGVYAPIDGKRRYSNQQLLDSVQ